MTPALYDALADLAGDALARRLPIRYAVDGRLPVITSAVYIVLDGSSRVRYVGSVVRMGADALRTRLREHGARPDWRWVLVIPLRGEVAASRVRQIEGAVGRVLNPCDNRRLPVAAV